MIEQTFDVKLQNPVVLPAPRAGHCYGIQRRLAGPVTVGVRKKDGFHSRFKGHLGRFTFVRLSDPYLHEVRPHRFDTNAHHHGSLPQQLGVV
ncbi:MAG TPA: hypothetical protein VFO20_11475 [Propionibacteriaceae bacterium]|nr:hypothetical protein [Propionibacteriaceae bacterium]